MANSFELITKYLPQAVDKYFAAESKTVILENGSKFIDVNFNEAGYVKIASFLMDGLSDYYRTQELPSGGAGYAAYAGNLPTGTRDGFAIGNVDVTWEIFKLQWCRGRQFRIDHISDEETGKIVTGALIEEFHRLKVIPEVDACRFSVIAGSASASLGNLITENSISANTIIAKFNAAFEWLTEHEVPEEEQVIFVNPSVMTLIRNTTELNKFLTQEDFRNANGLDFTVSKYTGRPIIEVPSSRFYTDVVTTSNGYVPGVGAKPINYMVCSMKAVVPVRKIEYSKVYGEDLTGLAGFYGTMMNYLLYHGVVIPRNKMIGTFVSVNGTANAIKAKANVLAVDIREGQTSGYFKLNAYFTMPSGLRGTVVYGANAFSVGAEVTIDDSTVFALPVGGEADADGATTMYFGLVDATGHCIAASEQVTLVVKA